MTEDEAAALVQRRLLAPLRHSLRVSFDGENWKLPGEKLKVRADVDEAVEEAVADSQDGGFPGRLVRYVTGDEVEREHLAAGRPTPSARSTGSSATSPRRSTANRATPTSKPSGDSLEVVAGEDGRKLRDNLLTEELNAAVLNANAPHTIVANVHATKPEVTKSEVAAEYPSYLTLDRASFTLRLWEDLKLAKTYTVAVGHGRAGNARRPLRDPGKGRKPDLARAGFRLGRLPRRAS